MGGRSGQSPNYRYGFNGMEKDDEWSNASGMSLDFGARLYDSRLGRWRSTDPMQYYQPEESPYKAMYNNPVIYNDPDGNTEYLTVIIDNQRTG